jgi:hypothetical protein
VRPLPAATVTSRCVRPATGVVVKSCCARQIARRHPYVCTVHVAGLLVLALTSVSRLLYLRERSTFTYYFGLLVVTVLADPDRVVCC